MSAQDRMVPAWCIAVAAVGIAMPTAPVAQADRVPVAQEDRLAVGYASTTSSSGWLHGWLVEWSQQGVDRPALVVRLARNNGSQDRPPGFVDHTSRLRAMVGARFGSVSERTWSRYGEILAGLVRSAGRSDFDGVEGDVRSNLSFGVEAGAGVERRLGGGPVSLRGGVTLTVPVNFSDDGEVGDFPVGLDLGVVGGLVWTF